MIVHEVHPLAQQQALCNLHSAANVAAIKAAGGVQRLQALLASSDAVRTLASIALRMLDTNADGSEPSASINVFRRRKIVHPRGSCDSVCFDVATALLLLRADAK